MAGAATPKPAASAATSDGYSRTERKIQPHQATLPKIQLYCFLRRPIMLATHTQCRASWHLVLIPFIVLLLAVPFVVKANWIALHLNNETTDPESALVQIGLWAAQSGALYPSLTETPFTPAPHGPAYYELLRILASPAPYDFQALEYKARLLSFLMYLLVCVELSVIARRLGVPMLLCLIPAVTLFTVPAFYPWSATARPDMIALFLNVTGILCFCWHSQANIRNIFVAGVVAGAAVVFKQSMAAAVLAIGLTLLLHRRWKDVVVLCVSATIVPLGVIGWLLYRREPLLAEMLIMRLFALDALSAAHMVIDMLRQTPSYLAVISLGTCGYIVVWGKRSLRFQVLVLYCSLAWLIGVLTMLNVGANENYLLEGWSAFALLAAFAVDEVRLSWEVIPGTVRLALVLLLLLTVPWQALACVRLRHEAVDRHVLELVHGRRVFSDSSYLSTQGTDPELLDSYTTTQLELHGRWSSLAIQDQLERGWFDLVILGYANGTIGGEYRGYPYLDEEIKRSIEARYRPLCVLKRDPLVKDSGFVLFVPRGEDQTHENDLQIQEACMSDQPGASLHIQLFEQLFEPPIAKEP